MARTVDQIYKELGAFFNPSAQIFKKAKRGAKTRFQSSLADIDAERARGIQDIERSVARKGMTFSGLGTNLQGELFGDIEDKRLRARADYQDRLSQLGSGLAGLRKEQGLLASQIRQGELDRAQARAAAAQQAANMKALAEAQMAAMEGDNYLAGQGVKPKDKKAGGAGGYAFKFGGKPVSALTYSMANEIPLLPLLKQMADSGDVTAGRAYLELLQSPNNELTDSILNRYRSLFWLPGSGTMSSAGRAAGQAAAQARPMAGPYMLSGFNPSYTSPTAVTPNYGVGTLNSLGGPWNGSIY